MRSRKPRSGSLSAMSEKKGRLAQEGRLSLVAQFDDLCRNRCRIMEDMDKQDAETVSLAQVLRVQVKSKIAKEAEIKELKQTLSSESSKSEVLTVKLKHLRSLVAGESEKRKKAEEQKIYLEGQINMIRDVLEKDQSCNLNAEMKKKLVHLSCTALNAPQLDRSLTWQPGDESLQNFLLPSEVSFDDTVLEADDTFPKSSSKADVLKRPLMTAISESHSEETIRSERKKPLYADLSDESSASNVVDGDKLSGEGSSTPTGRPRKYRKVCRMNRCSALAKARMRERSKSTCAVPASKSSNYGAASSTEAIENRCHSFGLKLVIRSAICLPCGGRIKPCRQALKCVYCRVITHTYCKEKMAVPCIPVPDSSPEKGFLADYCSASSPKVPAILYHCLLEIEKRGLEEIGLYMVPAPEKDVRQLAREFLDGKTLPNLASRDIHVVTGTVKWFLRMLREPLVTVAQRDKFLAAAERPGRESSLKACYQVVQDLPDANKQTLAYFILHLHRVASSRSCKMPLENLAKVFGPVIVDYPSSTDISTVTSTRKELKIMTLLLTLPVDFWRSQLSRSYNFTGSAGFVGRERGCVERANSSRDSSPAPATSRSGVGVGLLAEVPYSLFADVLDAEDVTCLDDYLEDLGSDDAVPTALVDYIDDSDVRERVKARLQPERIPKKYRKKIVELHPETAAFYGTPV